MSEPFYSPEGMEVAHDLYGAACGHGALAAALGKTVAAVMEYFERGSWVNIPIMRAAIAEAGMDCVKWEVIPNRGAGVVMIQWLGSWMNEGVPMQARAAHRHWIAVREGKVWDVNLPRWTTMGEWARWVPSIYPKGVTGYQVYGAYMISPR